MFRVIYIMLLSWVLTGTALATSVDEARALFLSGDYDAAITMATSLDNPDGLVVAAETLSAKVMLQQVEDANDSSKQARKWAEAALEAMPDSQEALVQYALAYGFETRTSSPFRAWRKKMPQKTLAAITNLRTRYPDDPRGDALLGAWHLGIIRKAGAKNGKKWYGANEADGITYYERAMGAAPQDIVIAANFAVTILALDMDSHYSQGSALLTHIMTMTPRNAVDRDVQTRIRNLSELVHDKEALHAAVIKMLDE